MKKLKWLYPGMLIKRWIFITALGVLLISVSFTVMMTEEGVANRTFASVLLIVGCVLVISGIKRMVKSFITVFMPEEKNKLVDKVYAKRILEKGSRVVALGGGHGLSTLLQGLKEYTSNITAIVTVTDDGGSSGRLRKDLNVLPPGDIRNCLVALASEEDLMGDLFQFRFNEGKELKGHNFGNLFITAMSRVTGDFEKAVKESSKVLAIRGNVVPSTTEKVVLIAEYMDGTLVEGESEIPKIPKPIKRISIRPENCSPTGDAIEAIRKADVIVIGPGSLYTSIIPNLLIKGLADAIVNSKAKKIYVCNVMTQHGETDGYKVSDHIKALIDHVGSGIVNSVVVNKGRISEKLLGKYSEQKAFPVEVDEINIKKLGCGIIKANIINFEDYVRHDPQRLAKIILDVIAE